MTVCFFPTRRWRERYIKSNWDRKTERDRAAQRREIAAEMLDP